MADRYPTLEDVLCADLNQLLLWHERLESPQTDVERTVRRRITKRIDDWKAEVATRTPPPEPTPERAIGEMSEQELKELWNRTATRLEANAHLPLGTLVRM